MKRVILYVVILVVVLLIPVEQADVADLRPVQTVMLYRDGNTVVLETDTGDMGRGSSSLVALQMLKATTPGLIYLDTADYLLLSEDAADEAEALRAHLKASVELYNFLGEIDLEAASKFLSVHGRSTKLKMWTEGTVLPILENKNNRLILSKKFENIS